MKKFLPYKKSLPENKIVLKFFTAFNTHFAVWLPCYLTEFSWVGVQRSIESVLTLAYDIDAEVRQTPVIIRETVAVIIIIQLVVFRLIISASYIHDEESIVKILVGCLRNVNVTVK